MNALVPIALYGWVGVSIVLFAMLPPRRAVIVTFIGGWLFLPVASMAIPGLPDISKVSMTSVAVLLGVMLVDARRLVEFRPAWVDIPMVVWCLIPIASSLNNDLGMYDAMSFILTSFLVWGAPYLIGRIYFCDLEAMRELAVGIVVAGLVYVPLCWIEMRMSPQIHRWVYGFHPSPFLMTMRWGGFRPMVFLTHGLMLGMWMSSATITAFWLWQTRAVTRIRNVPMSLAFFVLLGTSLFCRSTGSLLLLFMGAMALAINRRTQSTVLVALAILITPAYMYLRATDSWDGKGLVSIVSAVSTERAGSLEFRIDNESLIMQRALERKWFGWGGWGRWRVRDDQGYDITTSDGLWIIAFGRHGIVGLTAYMGILLLPVTLLLRRPGAEHWHHPSIAPAAVLGVLLIMFSIDCLFNAMPSPVYMIVAGGLGSLYLAWPRLLREQARGGAPPNQHYHGASGRMPSTLG